MAKTKSIPKEEIITIEAEEVIDAPVSEMVQKAIDGEVKRFDPFEARLNELKKEYTGLTIIDVDDKSGYEDVRLAIGELRKIRTDTEKDKKVIKAPFLKACASIEEKVKWIVREVSKLEDPLQARKNEIDAERDKIKAEKKAREEQQFIKRSLQLTQLGGQFNGTHFTVGDHAFEAVLVRECDQEIYESSILPPFQDAFNAAEAEKIEKERLANEEATRLQRERDEFERQKKELEEKQRELKEQQDAIQKAKEDEERRQAAEAKAKIDAIIRERNLQLESLGMVYSPAYGEYRFDDIFLNPKNFSEEEWPGALNEITAKVQERQAFIETKRQEQIEADKRAAIEKALEGQRKANEAATAAQRAKIGQQRLKMLTDIGYGAVYELPHLSDMPEAQWEQISVSYRDKYDKAQRELWEKEQQKKREEEEAKRLAEMEQSKDKDKWNDILTQLDSLSIHEMNSAPYRTKVKGLKQKVQEIKAL